MAHIGDFELIDKYAVGGVAEIYRARDKKTGACVVVKRMREDLDFDPEHQAGFLREVQVALAGHHKNLIRGITKGTIDGNDYAIFEYVEGPDLQKLSERLARSGVTMPADVVAYIVHEILDGLEFAWAMKAPDGREMGLVHRDLSPKNVFVGVDGSVRIGDFGSSLASKIERVDDIVGSPGYMSPEQASHEPLDARSDLFAVGLIVFELVTGMPAIDVTGRNDTQLLRAHQRAELRTLPKHVDEDWRMLIEVACALDREDRFASAKDMRHALLRTATPPTPSSRDMLASIVTRLFGQEFACPRLP